MDANVWMGLGHLSRCLTLAQQLRENGWETTFLVSSMASTWIAKIVNEGNKISLIEFAGAADPTRDAYNNWSWAEDAAACKRCLESKATWLIVDHYALDASWEREMKGSASRIMVIDDLFNRRHECDILVDQNLRDKDCYRDLIPVGAQALLGPQYALLRPEFRKALTGPHGVVRLEC